MSEEIAAPAEEISREADSAGVRTTATELRKKLFGWGRLFVFGIAPAERPVLCIHGAGVIKARLNTVERAFRGIEISCCRQAQGFNDPSVRPKPRA